MIEKFKLNETHGKNYSDFLLNIPLKVKRLEGLERNKDAVILKAIPLIGRNYV